MKALLQKVAPHVLIIMAFAVGSLIYFHPVLEGKRIFQSDIVQYTGMAKQQNDFRDQYDEESYWTLGAFSGMPTYQLGARYPYHYIKQLDRMIRFLPRPADYVFLYLLGFYILMLVIGVDFRLAALGAVAFALSTYLIIILGVGHNAKAHAIAYMPLVLSGILLTYKGKWIPGAILTALAVGLELSANHFQMTYYLLLLVVVLGITFAIDAYKNRTHKAFLKHSAILVVAALLGLGMNATNFMATSEYASESTRSQSELTINPDGSLREATSGLSRDYITEYSYGIVESMNLFIPRFMGGGNSEALGTDSEIYDAYRKLGASPLQARDGAANAPMYWGKQPIVEAPAYLGATVVCLFVLALFLIRANYRRWLVGGTVLALLLSYGKNVPFLTDLFIDFVPFYNKFRAVSSIQVLVELCVPLLAILGLAHIVNRKSDEKQVLRALKYTVVILGGVCVILLLFKGSLFDFTGLRDSQYAQAYGEAFVKAMKADRRAIFVEDNLRSLVFVLLVAGLIWMYLKSRIKSSYLIYGLLILVIIDLGAVDKRYVNAENFVSAMRIKQPFAANNADLEILKDTTYFRVWDITENTTKPNYYHNSIEGYHAAKLRRYNELLEFHVQQQNLEVLNMLNTRYIIAPGEDDVPMVLENTYAHGHAWFVESVDLVSSADQEIRALDTLNTGRLAISSAKALFDANGTQLNYREDSLQRIRLIDKRLDRMVYQTVSPHDAFAVFSEIYYPYGWQVTIDGEPAMHYPVNYVLRGMPIPAGEHEIVFRFDPEVVKRGTAVTLGSNLLVLLLIVGGLILGYRKR